MHLGYGTRFEYGADSACSITITAAARVTAVKFNTHTSSGSGRDFVTLGTDEYEGTTGPSGKVVPQDTTLTWTTDANTHVGGGWVFCAEELAPCETSSPSAPSHGTVGAYAWADLRVDY